MTLNQPYTVTTETFDSITGYWLDPQHTLKWDCLFVVPGWLKVWWQIFGSGLEPHLCSIRHNDKLVGIAPLLFQGGEGRLIGSPDVCDYLDFIVTPGSERVFFQHLIPYLREQGISRLDLGVVRAGSVILSDLFEVAKSLDCTVYSEPEDVTMELDLPSTWDQFLKQLTGKERHEIKRKFRRLNEAGRVNFRTVERPADVREGIDLFLALFKLNRSDKSDFMTDQRASFFRSLAKAMAEAGLLRLYFLDIDEAPAAVVMSFDYNSTIFLYNNGYDNQYRSLSVGLLSKVFTIQDGIRRGKRKYDFLKGTEAYKHRLGGRSVRLYRCQIEFG